jgi:hypothetical protein
MPPYEIFHHLRSVEDVLRKDDIQGSFGIDLPSSDKTFGKKRHDMGENMLSDAEAQQVAANDRADDRFRIVAVDQVSGRNDD